MKMSPEEFFTLIDRFLVALQNAFEERESQRKDDEKKAKLEEKKAARKVAAATKKKKGKPKEGVLDNIIEAAATGQGFRELRRGKTKGNDIADITDGLL
jgi:hypothetical protein